MVTCTLSINLWALCTSIQHMCLEVEPLNYKLSISTPSREIILSKEKVKACQIEIASHVLDATLLVLDMREVLM